MHLAAADRGLHGHVPARPRYTTPHIRFLFIAPQFRTGLPSDPVSRQRPCPSPCLRLCSPDRRTFTYEVTRHARRTRRANRLAKATLWQVQRPKGASLSAMLCLHRNTRSAKLIGCIYGNDKYKYPEQSNTGDIKPFRQADKLEGTINAPQYFPIPNPAPLFF